MRAYSGDTEIGYSDFVMRTSFNQVYSTVKLTTDTPVTGVVSLEEDGQTTELYTLSTKTVGNQFEQTLIPLSYAKLATECAAEFKGETTFNQLCQQRKLSVVTDIKFPSQYWEIPSMNIESFLSYTKYLTEGTKAPVSTILLTGELAVIDLKERLKLSPVCELGLEKAAGQIKYDWMFKSALSVQTDLLMVTKDEASQVEITQNWGKGRAVKFVTNEKLAEQVKTEILNKMGVVECTTTCLQVIGTAIPTSIGLPVSIGGINTVITEVEARPHQIKLSCSTNQNIKL